MYKNQRFETSKVRNIKGSKVATDSVILRPILERLLESRVFRNLTDIVAAEHDIIYRDSKSVVKAAFIQSYIGDRVVAREICLNVKRIDKEEELFRCIVFETVNALFDSFFTTVPNVTKRSSLNAEEFVRTMEIHEYNNLKIANALFKNIGEETDILINPYRITDLENHLAIQKISGHSNAFYSRYNGLRGLM